MFEHVDVISLLLFIRLQPSNLTVCRAMIATAWVPLVVVSTLCLAPTERPRLHLPTESLFDECCATLRHGSVDFDARMPTTGRPKSSVQESPLQPTHETRHTGTAHRLTVSTAPQSGSSIHTVMYQNESATESDIAVVSEKVKDHLVEKVSLDTVGLDRRDDLLDRRAVDCRHRATRHEDVQVGSCTKCMSTIC